MPFTIAYEDIEWPQVCPVLHIRLDYTPSRGGGRDASPSFDRRDPSIGYVRGNVLIISARANRIKSNATIHEIRAVADWLESHI